MQTIKVISTLLLRSWASGTSNLVPSCLVNWVSNYTSQLGSKKHSAYIFKQE